MSLADYTERLRNRTVRSATLFQRAVQRLPGGVSANLKYMEPYPLYMQHAEGAYLFDVDGNRYVDYLLVFGSLLLGHGHPAILNALRRQLERAGTVVFGPPHEQEVVLAERLAELYPSMEMTRFTNSGLEATLLAVRIARAATGRPLVAKFEGHYHGAHPDVLVSVHPPLAEAGHPKKPRPVPDAADVSEPVLQRTLVLPWNDPEAVRAMLDAHGDRVAALILEPTLAGYIEPEPGFLSFLREETRKRGIVLIFDEIKTGFRLALGGAQQVYDVAPDLTVLGKVLGGGLPIGAVGGRRDLMEFTRPRPGRPDYEHVYHSGTFNGHPLAIAAGLATLEVLCQPDLYETLFVATHRLRQGIEAVLRDRGIPAVTQGKGSIFNVLITDRPARSYRDVLATDLAVRRALDLALLEQGVYNRPLNRFSLSIAHTQEVIDRTVEAFANACLDVVPMIDRIHG